MATNYPDLSGDIVMSLLQSLSTDIGRYMMASESGADCARRIERSVAAYTQAIERSLGVASGSLYLADPTMFDAWAEALARANRPYVQTPQ